MRVTRERMMQDALLILRPTPEEFDDCVEDIEWALELFDRLAMLQASREFSKLIGKIRRGGRRSMVEIRKERAHKRREKFKVVT